MGCNCGKPKCDGKCGISPAVLEINNNGCIMFHKVSVPASMGTSTENPPKVGAYKNVILYYEADSEAYIYSSDGIPTKITGVSTDYNILQNKPSINNVVLIGNKTLTELGITGAIDDAVSAEAALRYAADQALEQEIDDLRNNPDVVDIVGTYAELQAYDTSSLGDNDIVKVLQDETHGGASTYYKWHKNTSTWEYIGEQGPYYTKSQTDTLLAAKADISSLAPVATSGSYNDLTNKPTIGNATLTVQKNSATVGTFTANSTTDTTIDIAVPTKTSDLTNDGADGTSTYVEMDEITGDELTGEGTAITLNGTSDCTSIEVAELLGNTAQTTISGKNLFDVSDVVSQGTNTTVSADGKITSAYDNTGGSSSVYENYWTNKSDLLETSTTYYIVCEIFAVSGSGYLNILTDNNGASQFTTYNISRQFSELHAGDVLVVSDTTKADFTGSTYMLRTFASIAAGSNSSITYRLTVQKEATTPSTFVYTPFTGGTASPNPDYPQTVNVVSGEQTVKITGENLFDKDNIATFNNYYVDSTGKIVAGSNNKMCYIKLSPSKTYTLTQSIKSVVNTRVAIFSTTPTAGSTGTVVSTALSAEPINATFATTDDDIYLAWVYYNSAYPDGHTEDDMLNSIQLELGNQATDYEPYQGQSYTIDLDTMELCKIGTYQDYIYKSGDKWYKHEAVGKINMADIVGWATSTGGSLYATGFTSAYNAKVDITLSNIFTHDWTTWAGAGKFGITSSGNLWIMTGDTSVVDSNVSTWLASKSAIMFYILATPTDTEITDSELVGQLDALLEAHGYDGTTNIFALAASPNLPTSLAITAYTDSVVPTATKMRAGIVKIGENISVDECGTISAVDTTYTAGSGIDITGTVISGMTASVSGTTLILNNA